MLFRFGFLIQVSTVKEGKIILQRHTSRHLLEGDSIEVF